MGKIKFVWKIDHVDLVMNSGFIFIMNRTNEDDLINTIFSNFGLSMLYLDDKTQIDNIDEKVKKIEESAYKIQKFHDDCLFSDTCGIIVGHESRYHAMSLAQAVIKVSNVIHYDNYDILEMDIIKNLNKKFGKVRLVASKDV